MPQRFDILEYREFYDFPRAIILVDPSERRLFLSCAFDNDLDDYLEEFAVYAIHKSFQPRNERSWGEQFGSQHQFLGNIRCSSVEFDETKRSFLVCSDLERLLSAKKLAK